jgi:hypothetical protein
MAPLTTDLSVRFSLKINNKIPEWFKIGFEPQSPISVFEKMSVSVSQIFGFLSKNFQLRFLISTIFSNRNRFGTNKFENQSNWKGILTGKKHSSC